MVKILSSLYTTQSYCNSLWRVRSRVVFLLVFGMAGWMIADLFEMFGVLEWLVLLFHGL